MRGGVPVANRTQRHQELGHGEGHDYRAGSPHLKHLVLHDLLVDRLRGAFDLLDRRGLPLTVLDVGAGDGGFEEPSLSYGCSVTATEMSRPAVSRLERRYGRNPNFEVIFDATGSLAELDSRRFSLVLFASVLHHIPDYLAAIDQATSQHLALGGTLVTLQDPLWYPSLGRCTRVCSEAAFLSWRVTRGNLGRGMRSRLRRLRDDYRDDEPSDVVEYHVVREGVNQEAIRTRLEPSFERVEVDPYWSAHARLWQRVGQRLPLTNTFAVIAEGYQGTLAA